jgi:hypothetical protein
LIQNELIDLFRTLKRLVLDRDRRFESNASEQVRSVLTVLLQLNSINSSGSDSGIASYHRIQRTLQAVINSPDLVALPALRNLAQYTLLNFENTEKAKSNTPPSPLSTELEAIRTANAEITSILPPTQTALETLIYNYVSDILQCIPGKFNQDPLNRLLGYTFTDCWGDLLLPTSTHSPHIQRAREIMGPAISETMDVCEGFWCDLLTVENFFALVAAHQTHGGVRSDGFRKLLREIEGGIDEGLRAGLKRVNEGYPYRFGVDAPGLVKLGEGEGLSYEDQLFCLEAQSRLKYMRVNREAREQDEQKERNERRQDSNEEKYARQMEETQ